MIKLSTVLLPKFKVFTALKKNNLIKYLKTQKIILIVYFRDRLCEKVIYTFILQAGNHDNSRVASRFSPKLVDGINMILLLMPGIAVTYMVSGLLNSKGNDS